MNKDDMLSVLAHFSQGGFGFQDHWHAVNYLKYMFSQSKAHPANELTNLNLIQHYNHISGEVTRSVMNIDPAAENKLSQGLHMPRQNAHKSLDCDGAYPYFTCKIGDSIVSNVLYLDGGEVRVVRGVPELIRQIMGAHMGQKMINKMVIMAGSGTLRSFKELPQGDLLISIERELHQRVRNLSGGRHTVLTVSHRDQPDHNPQYHIHRLYLK